jgi:hypothetical protein
MAIMGIERAKDRMAIIKDLETSDDKKELTLDQLLMHSPKGPISYFKPHSIGWRHIEPGLPPYVDQTSLYVEIMREAFEIS